MQVLVQIKYYLYKNQINFIAFNPNRSLSRNSLMRDLGLIRNYVHLQFGK